MAYRRGGFALTPPSIIVFAISVVFAIVALLIYYNVAPIRFINRQYVFEILLIGYLLLLAGVVFRRI